MKNILLIILSLCLLLCCKNNKQASGNNDQSLLLEELTEMRKACSIYHKMKHEYWTWYRQEYNIQDMQNNIHNIDYSHLKDSIKIIFKNSVDKLDSLLQSDSDNLDFSDILLNIEVEILGESYPYERFCQLSPEEFQKRIKKEQYATSYDEIDSLTWEVDIKRILDVASKSANTEERVIGQLIVALEYANHEKFSNAIELYQNILDTKEYSIYLHEIWVRWRTLYQIHDSNCGISWDADIPNDMYNSVREKCLDVIYEYITQHPKDQMAINQFYAMAVYKNASIGKQGLMGMTFVE